MISLFRPSLAAAILLGLIYGGTGKSATIDQQNGSFDSYIGPGSGQGQSFTPTVSGIDFATFTLGVSAGNIRNVFVTLLSGAGFGGTQIGVSLIQPVDGSLGFQPYEFDFSSVIPLTPGQTYTLALHNAFNDLYALEGSGNPYARGVEYDSSGTAQAGYDLVFSEGLNQAVPEPTTISLIGVGFLGILGMRRRKAPKR